ncbi:ABC transporter permease [Pseudanabaena sp. FACHB-2040]|uniref:ABC transporter permease n=1 Tax=Pseudanabaena sp. FACHB-2040 TaxID=2692859 RepID=UPI001688AA3C|nr:ABC transporter permease [Pseudanabaena sp. FACHB-2040]MBD2257277.1 ABC transporter permease [Pseudanabaena sp. FACHB-2040]
MALTVKKLLPTQVEAYRYWEILQVLVERNLKVRYRGSLLGIYWSLLNPLIMTGVYTTIFGTTFAEYYNNSILNYILAAFTGMAVINFFSTSTSQALSSLVNNGSLLNKMHLPMSAFPLSIIAANAFQFCLTVWPLLVVMTLLISYSVLNAAAVILPFVGLTMVCTGIGLLMAALNVFFRDLPYMYELVTFALWITSPIFYPSAIVPEEVAGFLQLNPMYPIIESTRQIVLSGEAPDLTLVATSWLSGIIFMSFGWFTFKWLKPQFMDLL